MNTAIDRQQSYEMMKQTLEDASFGEYTAYNPLMLAFEITTCCNLHCIRCERRAVDPVHLDRHMDRETFERLSVLFPYVRGVSIVGGLGEPLLAPHFWDFVERMKYAGTQVQYFTNGTHWTEQAMVQTVEMNVDAVVFSMDGLSPAVYQRLKTGARYEHSRQRIDRFVRLRREMGGTTKLVLNCAVQGDTLDEMIPLLQYAADNEIDRVWFTGVITHRDDQQPYSHLHLDLSRLQAYYAAAGAAAERLGVDVRLPAGHLKPRQICLDLWTNLYVFYNGDVCACPHFREPKTYYFHVNDGRIVNEPRKLPHTILGNVHHVDVRTLWNGDKHRALRTRMLAGCPKTPCRGCHFSHDLH